MAEKPKEITTQDVLNRIFDIANRMKTESGKPNPNTVTLAGLELEGDLMGLALAAVQGTEPEEPNEEEGERKWR